MSKRQVEKEKKEWRVRNDRRGEWMGEGRDGMYGRLVELYVFVLRH